MTKKTNKRVFGIIDLSSPKKEQENVAFYAAELAASLGLGLTLYPKNSGTKLSFREGFIRVRDIAKGGIRDLDVVVSRKQINIFNFMKGLHDIAAEEKAEIIVMGVEKSEASALGQAIWGITQKTIIPILLLPHGANFSPWEKITIAIDAERKMQKMKTVSHLAKTFGSTINIFKESVEDNEKEKLFISNGLKHITGSLEEKGISYLVTNARKTSNFPKHLCKFSAKNSDLLVIEVDPGKIDGVVKQNIAMLLSIDDTAQPVLLTKTKMLGKWGSFH